MINVLVIGKDGRSHCIADRLVAGGATVYALGDFRNPGLMSKAKAFRQARVDDVPAVLDFARSVRPDLVVIGPEEPLAVGVVDAILQELGIPCVGPTKGLARLETSKSFTRTLMTKYNLPGNLEYKVFTTLDGIEGYLRHLGEFVVKPDGLTGGKGVRVSGEHLSSVQEAVQYAAACLKGGPIVIEERLEGEEFSFQSLCDGDTVIDTVPVQDHKRAHEGDTGPNTGGMGSYSCEDHKLPFLRTEDVAAASEINSLVAKALREEFDVPYKGVLYGGFMLTAKGVRLLEYNARFGDPEAMNVLSILETNFVDVCHAVATGWLNRIGARFLPKATVCKYVVPKDYPVRPVRNVPIDLSLVPDTGGDLRMYFAAVDERDGEMILTGSRAIAFVGIGSSLTDAETVAERAANSVKGPVTHRRDIGTMQLVQKRIDHIKRLRDSGKASLTLS